MEFMFSAARMARKIITHLTASAPRATRRRVSLELVRDALAQHLVACRTRRGTIVTHVDGGAVPGAYKYVADTDCVTVVTQSDGTTTWECGRTYARKVPGGRGALARVQAIVPGAKRGIDVAVLR